MKRKLPIIFIHVVFVCFLFVCLFICLFVCLLACLLRRPRGAVKSETSESFGFCLLNNISIGAAYAMNVYRETIKRVAIVDFG